MLRAVEGKIKRLGPNVSQLLAKSTHQEKPNRM